MNSVGLARTWEGQAAAGRFPLLQWLGGSERRAVFLTEHNGQKATIKLVAANGLDVDRQLSRWATASKLSHPHLLRLFEAGRCDLDGRPFLYVVTEYAEENLSQVIPDRPLTPAEAGELLPPVLDALSYLHSRGLVHGRIRPSDIFAIGNQLKLSIDSVGPWGEAEKNVGPLDIYDAPEIAAGEVSPAIDVWSLGVTLVVVLTQRLPAYRTSDQKDPAVPESIPEPFHSIACECLHRIVKQRCTITDIKAWRPPQVSPLPATPATLKEKEEVEVATYSKGSRVRVAIAAAFSLIAVFVLISFVHRDSKDKPDPQQLAVPGKTNSETPQQVTPPVASKPTANLPKSSLSSGAVVRQVIPDVPLSARNTITGKIKVVVHVDVDASGKVMSAKLTHSGPSRYFANLALKAAQQWGFNSQPSPSRWNLTFQFARAGTKAFAAQERIRH